MDIKIKREKRKKRHKRIRAKIIGTIEIPRLYVFRSAKHIYVQLIIDSSEGGKIIVAVNDRKIKKGGTKIDKAKEVGMLIAREALVQKIKKVVFDRGGYKYHGRIKAVAEGAREGGLLF
jgi:large subunit ribosomal protein L18